MKKYIALFLSLVLVCGIFTGCTGNNTESIPAASMENEQVEGIDENGSYTSKEEVALYIVTYDRLPNNYITKAEARALGWNTEGTLDEVAPGKSIGGDYFGNYEGILPEEAGRDYHECDIDYESGSRNAKRLVYSDDGNVYYTEDHYNTFEHLYGDDE